jgi:hypothetical protein
MQDRLERIVKRFEADAIECGKFTLHGGADYYAVYYTKDMQVTAIVEFVKGALPDFIRLCCEVADFIKESKE